MQRDGGQGTKMFHGGQVVACPLGSFGLKREFTFAIAMIVQIKRFVLHFDCCKVCWLDSAAWLVQSEEGDIGFACLLLGSITCRNSYFG